MSSLEDIDLTMDRILSKKSDNVPQSSVIKKVRSLVDLYKALKNEDKKYPWDIDVFNSKHLASDTELVKTGNIETIRQKEFYDRCYKLSDKICECCGADLMVWDTGLLCLKCNQSINGVQSTDLAEPVTYVARAFSLENKSNYIRYLAENTKVKTITVKKARGQHDY